MGAIVRLLRLRLLVLTMDQPPQLDRYSPVMLIDLANFANAQPPFSLNFVQVMGGEKENLE